MNPSRYLRMVAVAVWIFGTVLTLRTASVLPIYDQFLLLDWFRSAQEGMWNTDGLLYLVGGVHVHLVPRLLAFAVFLLAGSRVFLWFPILSLLLTGTVAAACAVLVRRSIEQEREILTPLLLTCVFLLVHFVHPHALLGFVIVDACLFLMIVAQTQSGRWFRGVAIACATVASLSSLHGLLLWPIGWVQMRMRSHRERPAIALWCGCGVLVTSLVVIVLLSQRSVAVLAHIPPSFHPLSIGSRVLVLLGMAVLPLRTIPHAAVVLSLLGSAVLCTMAYLVFASLRSEPGRRNAALPWILLMASGCAAVGAVAIGRTVVAQDIRYVPLSAPIVIGILGTIWSLQLGRRRARTALAAGMMIVYCCIAWDAALFRIWMWHTLDTERSCLTTFEHMHPSCIVEHRTRFLKDIEKTTDAYYAEAVALGMVEPFHLPDSVVFRPSHAHVRAHLDAIEPTDDGVQVRGWAVHTACREPMRIVLTDSRGEPVAQTTTMLLRRDVGARVACPFLSAGWSIAVPQHALPDNGILRAWVFLPQENMMVAIPNAG